MSEEQNTIDRDDSDRKYFIMTPRLVLFLTDPYEFKLWSVVKDISWSSGVCYIGTPDLAKLCQMSVGMVHKCRLSLIEKCLLKGKKQQDKGQQETWHLSIPDIWPSNLKWCLAYPEHKDRIKWLEERASLSCGESLKGGELSPDEDHHSHGETHHSPHERSLSPHETIKIKHKDIQEDGNKINPLGASAPVSVPAGSPEGEPSIIKNQRAFEALRKNEELKGSGEFDLSVYPEECRVIIREFCSLWSLDPPVRSTRKGGEYLLWISEARELRNACGEFGISALKEARRLWDTSESRWNVGHPGAITKTARAAAGKLRTQKLASLPGGSPYQQDLPKMEEEPEEPEEIFEPVPPVTAPAAVIYEVEPAARKAWDDVMYQLEMDVPRNVFDEYVEGLEVVCFEGDVITIGGQNGSVAWVESRLSSKITKLLSACLGRPVAVTFANMPAGA